MNLINRKILVTGAGGFIGSHLIEDLVKLGANVRAFVHYNSRNDWGNIELLPDETKRAIEVVSGDIVDSLSVRKAVNGCSIVFHLAALIGIPYSYMAPESYINTNIIGTLNVLNAALELGVEKLVNTSTSETYGTALYTPIDEKHPLQGQSPYSASKIGADKLAESFFLSFGLPVATIRPFNAYGPRQSARAVIPSIISQILSGEKCIKLGSLEPVRDLSYIKDTTNAFLKICQSDLSAGEVINVGCGRGISISELVNVIKELTGSNCEVLTDNCRIRPKNSEVMKLVCNYEKARRLIGWEPEINLRDGLKFTINFIKENINFYKTEIYNV